MKWSCLSVAVLSTAVCGSAIAALPTYTISPLDAAPGQTDVYANGINNLGQIVGYTADADGFNHAALWNASTGAWQALGDLSATNPISEAYRINNLGQIVGKAHTDSNAVHATTWNAGSPTDMGTLPSGATSFAMDINDAGVVAGSSTALHGQHAFTWTQGGGFIDYGSDNINANTAIAGFNAINNTGKMAGTHYILFSPFKACMARVGDHGITNISGPGQFSQGMGLAINDAGTIVGYQNGGSGSPHAAIFNEDGTYQDLGSLGLSDSWAEDISETGLIVGRAFGDDGTGDFVQKAVAYNGTTMVELASLLEGASGAGWSVLFQASGVNDLGQIVGAGIYNGEIRGFVASPAVPEPATFTLPTIASALLRRRRRT